MELEIQGHTQPTAKVEFLQGQGCARDDRDWPLARSYLLEALTVISYSPATIDTTTNL